MKETEWGKRVKEGKKNWWIKKGNRKGWGKYDTWGRRRRKRKRTVGLKKRGKVMDGGKIKMNLKEGENMIYEEGEGGGEWLI